MSEPEPLPTSAMPSPDESCAQAMRYQVAGRLDLAEPLYRAILRAAPAHGATNYCLGMLLVQLRTPAQGLPHLLAALDAKPDVADYWLGYMEALLSLGMHAQATQTLALAREHGLAGTATDDFAVRLELASAPAASMSAAAMPRTATPATAMPATATPAVATPAIAMPAIATPATAMPAIATPATAMPATATPATATPAIATPAIATPATAMPATAMPATAMAATAMPAAKLSPGARRRQALSRSRQEAAVLGLVKAGRFNEALPLARDMTELFPEHGIGWKVYAAMLWAVQSPEAALSALHTSVRLLPQDAEAHTNLGTALNKLRRLDEAEQWLKSALRIDVGFAAAHSQLGDNYQLQGRYAEAESSFRHAITLFPRDFSAEIDAPHSGLLFMLNHNPTVDADELFAEHRGVGEYLERSVREARPQHRNDPDPDRRLRIGLVSADLRNHAVTSFVEPVLRRWANSETLRTAAYYGYPTEDDETRRIKGYVSTWRSIFGMSNPQLAQQIAEDGIDLLIDLSGHTAMHRLAAFAHRPAPIQISWLGYPATTGLSSMDYYLTDKHFFPPGRFDRHFTEKLIYLPAVWPFEPFAEAPSVNRLPALESRALTFGSFNRLGKINQTTVRLWSRVLCQLPEARMVIAGVPLQRQHRQLIDWFAEAGVSRNRLSFHPWTNQEAHLALHHPVDIALETTPYTGCTTSNHALWMGVPTLTLVGATPASRLCAANLGHLGLEEFIASTGDEFVAKARYWSENLGALADLRAGMRARWLASPARDPAFVADGIERALRRMWQRWCAGLPPESFEITAPGAAGA